MPFGICSAPGVFQHGKHELIEGLHGTEAIAGDFAVVGFRDTLDEAMSIMTRIWMHSYCDARKEGSVKYGQGTTQEAGGIYWKCSHRAGSVCGSTQGTSRNEMLPHKNVVAIQHLLGLNQYLSNSCPTSQIPQNH